MISSSARSTKSVCFAAALLLLQPAGGAAPHSPVYRGRELIGPSSPVGILNHSLPPLDGRQLQFFNALDAERSLLIHNCQGWCDQSDFSFARTMQHATSSMSLLKEAGTMQGWYSSACQIPTLGDICTPESGLPQRPLHLLAVVNRLDLATWSQSSDRWTGAEVRFVYGPKAATNEAIRFTLIVEFRYAPLTWGEFQGLANKWAKLSATNVPLTSASFGSLLANVLEDVGLGVRGAFELVRIRANYRSTGGQWFLLQWNLNANSQWASAPLDDQIDPDCYDGKGKPACSNLPKIWDQIAATPDVTRWRIPLGSGLSPSFAQYVEGTRPMRFLPGRSQDEPRRILSLQQCTQCHRPETGTDFNHVRNKVSGAPVAVLSSFLAGAGGSNPNPSYESLMDRTAATPVTLQVQTANGSGTTTVLRHFHDLGRRRLFMAALLAAPPSYSAEAETEILAYTTDFTH